LREREREITCNWRKLNVIDMNESIKNLYKS